MASERITLPDSLRAQFAGLERALWRTETAHAACGAAAALTASACTYTGGVENPVARKSSWFSFVGGDDVRNRCRPGSPTEYRLVYNGNWSEQVRAYELRRSVLVGGGARLDTVVFGGEPTRQLNHGKPITNILSAYRQALM